jgi:hypothetical protein
MIRIGIAIGALVVIIACAFFVGTNWNKANEEQRKAETLQRIQDADVSKGNENDDRNWLSDFLGGLSE